jgi:peptidoglycan/LPS O-acetylase OafA/YrhL
LRYRADIDGLRALSVIAVVLYHAGLPLFGGGFVGVDVFFVISGFLITSLILHEQEAGTFSLLSFYHRRIRRILPALFAVMGASAIGGWFLLAPDDYVKLGRSIASATLSTSNIQFWLESGYFDTAPAEKPLLHTWSLGVEEQFYLLFPLYLILVARYLPRRRLPLTIALCLMSLTIGSVGAFRDPVAAFYLPQSRLWELLVGGLLAMGVPPSPKHAGARAAAGLLGLALVIGAILFYAEDTHFPGLGALPPTLGAALIIWAGNGPSVVSRALAAKPLVFIGKISYSLYLWHFPLLAFGFYVGLGELTAAHTAALLALAFLLALLSWRFIEQPARLAGARLPWRRVASFAAAGVLALSLGGIALVAKDGFPSRLTDEAQRLMANQPMRNPDRQHCYVSSPARIATANLCVMGDAAAAPSFVLWGDSHGEMLRAAVGSAASAAGRAGWFVGEHGCAPLIGVTRPERPLCLQLGEAYLRMIVETPAITDVVIAARWAFWSEGMHYLGETGMPPATLVLTETPLVHATDNHAALAAGLERTISTLLSAGKRVWLVGPVPEVGYNVPRYFYLRSIGFAGDLAIAPTLAEFGRRQEFVFDLLGDLERRYPIGAIWPHERLCGDAGCEIARDGHALYSDDDHLSVFGAQSIASMFAPVFD